MIPGLPNFTQHTCIDMTWYECGNGILNGYSYFVSNMDVCFSFFFKIFLFIRIWMFDFGCFIFLSLISLVGNYNWKKKKQEKFNSMMRAKEKQKRILIKNIFAFVWLSFSLFLLFCHIQVSIAIVKILFSWVPML